MNTEYQRPAAPGQTRQHVLIGILIGLVVGLVLVGQIRGWTGRKSAVPQAVTPRGDLAEDEKSTIQLFEQASASVVFITTHQRKRDFWGMRVLEIPQGTGSGFVWNTDGHIVTNFHVLQGADAVEVTLADHTTWDAKVVGVAPSKDLAVLWVPATPDQLKPLPIGTSRDLLVGQKVFAIGNPFGFDHTLTTGVVSALGRTISSFNDRTIDGVIQTDAAINPGNSGGPLLDSAGRLIGVNTQIASPSGTSVGIGFAVPADIVNKVVPQLIEHGRIIRPDLGVDFVDDSIVRRWGLVGVLVGRVAEGTSAAKEGLEGTYINRNGRIVLGDLIVAIDDKQIASSDDLLSILEEHKAGDTVRITFTRNGKNHEADIVLRMQP